MEIDVNTKEFTIFESSLDKLWDAYFAVDKFPQGDLIDSVETESRTIQDDKFTEIKELFDVAIDKLRYLDENERRYGRGGYDVDPDDFVLDLSYKFAFVEESGKALWNAEEALENIGEALEE